MKPLIRIATLCVLGTLLGACASSPTTSSGYRSSTTAKPAATEVESEFRAALELMNMGRTDEATQQFAHLAQRHPGYSGPWTNLGILQAQGGYLNDAHNAFQSALRANRHNVVAMNWLGYVCAQQGQWAQAQHWYERALATQPDYALARLNLALLYDTALRQPQLALEHYRRYRDQADSDNVIVEAWIRELESNTATVPRNAQLTTEPRSAL